MGLTEELVAPSRIQRVSIVVGLALITAVCGFLGLVLLLIGIGSKARLDILGLSAPMFLPGLLLLYLSGRNIPRLVRLKREILAGDARFDWSNLDFSSALRAFFSRPQRSPRPVTARSVGVKPERASGSVPDRAQSPRRGFARRAKNIVPK